MLSFEDEQLINKCIDDYIKINNTMDISNLKLRIWDFANLISQKSEITEETIKKVISDYL